MFLNIEQHPKDAIAVIDEADNCLTYGELIEGIDRVARYFPSRQLIFILCDNSPGALLGYLACMEHGCVPLMLDSAIAPALLSSLLDTYCPTGIWAPAACAFPGQRQTDNTGFCYTACSGVSGGLHPSLALLVTTSGSTGSPKLVRQTLNNLTSNARSIVDYLGLTASERPIAHLPMNYVFGISIINSHLLVGATLALTSKGVMQREFWDQVRRQSITSLSGVPYTFELLAKLRFMRMSLPALTTLTQAGGKLSPVLQAEFAAWAQAHKKRFFVMYGACEATSRMGYLPAELCVEKNGAMGRAIPGGCFELHDEHGQAITAPGTVGELVYFGDNVTLGYAVCREDLAREDDNHGQLVTGDMARVDQDGIYTIVGRKKRFLKVFGNRVGLDDIEQRVKGQFPGLECAAGGEDDHVRVYITQPEQADAVRHFLVTTFQFHHSAFEVRVRDEIPKNAAGKTLYAQLEAS